jgi:hypothetical protein
MRLFAVFTDACPFEGHRQQSDLFPSPAEEFLHMMQQRGFTAVRCAGRSEEVVVVDISAPQSFEVGACIEGKYSLLWMDYLGTKASFYPITVRVEVTA